MNDLIKAAEPKSDQLNADDLVGGDKIIKITSVEVKPNAPQQKVTIHYDGENGKPYKPAITMYRLLMEKALFGADPNKWIGQHIKLFRDPTIRFGKEAVGGIRISHVTGIKLPVTLPVTTSRGYRVSYTVSPLEIPSQSLPIMNPEKIKEYKSKITVVITETDLSKIGAEIAAISEQYNQESIADLKRHYAARLKEFRDSVKTVSRETPDQENISETIKRIASETNDHGDLYDLITIDYADNLAQIKEYDMQEYEILNAFLQSRLKELEGQI